MEEAISLLHEIITIHKESVKRHEQETSDFRSLFIEQSRRHNEEVEELHDLLDASEKRINDTNEMVRTLSNTIKELKDSYQLHLQSISESRDLALKNEQKVLAENERLLKENEAYYTALKSERKRYDSVMNTVISSFTDKRSAPMVSIDQK